MSLPALLTVDEAARRLGVAVGTVRRLVHTGVITGYRKSPGKRAPMVIEESEIERYHASLRIVPDTGERRLRTRDEERRALGLETRHEFR